MDFGDGSIAAEIFDALGEGGIRVAMGYRRRCSEEGALGIDAGDLYGGGGKFFAAGEDEAGDCTVFNTDVADFGVGTDFGAGCADRVGKGAG